MLFSYLPTDHYRGATIFLDIDGTIVADREREMTQDIKIKLQSLVVANNVYLASNGEMSRTEIIAREIGAKILPKFYKPLVPRAIHLDFKDVSTVVIGDKYLTDGIFAFSLGAEFVKVDHVYSGHESFLIKISYLIDNFIWFIAPFLIISRFSHWIKNFLVFAPVFFAGDIFKPTVLMAATIAFVSFSIAASGVYAFNDIFDREGDILHSRKKRRPIAAGRLSVAGAYGYIAVLGIFQAVLLVFHPILVTPIMIYIALNIVYTTWLKHIAIVDILIIAILYPLRLIGGSVVTGIPLSPWIILCTFFVALFIAASKRRAEYYRNNQRKVLAQYTKESLDFILVAGAALAIISYGLYSVFSHHSPLIIYSTFFVILALFRTVNHTYTHPCEAESPETLLFKDPWIFGAFVLWILNFLLVFYFLS